MKRERILVLLTLLVIGSMKGEPPDPVINNMGEKHFTTAGGIEGFYFTMMVSVSPDGQKISISRRYYNFENKTKKPQALVYDINEDDFKGEKQFPSTISTLSLAFLLSGTKGVTMCGDSFTPGELQFYTIGASITEEGALKVPSGRGALFQFDIKLSANLAIVTVAYGEKDYYYINLGTGEVAKSGKFNEVSADLGTQFSMARLNPEDSISQILVLGSNHITVLIDFTKQIAGDDIGAKLYSKDDDWSSNGVQNDVSLAEYNHKDASHFLYLGFGQSTAKNSIGLLVKITEIPDFEAKVPLKLGYTSGDFYSLVNPKSIQGTDYFFVLRFSDYKMNPATVETFIVDSTYTDGVTTELAFKDVTSFIKPSGAATFNVLGMDIIDKYTGKWAFVGNDGTDGYAMITTFGPPYQFICHTDCDGCSRPEDSTKCLGCSDPKKLLLVEGGPSPCADCHTDCDGCSRPEDSTKCLGCSDPKKGLLTKGGPSSCEDCHEACDGCSVAGDKKECSKCATGYIEKSGACEKEERNDGNRTDTSQLATLTCGKTIIPGCEKCSQNSTEGCKKCQRGAGLESKGGFKYCILCPDPKCEICYETLNGRQCQKCFDGYKFNSRTQKCWSGIFFIGGLVSLFGLFVR